MTNLTPEQQAQVEEERDRIHNYVRVLINNGDLKINDGVLLWDIIQDTLSIKYGQVGLAVKLGKKSGKLYGKWLSSLLR